MKARGRSGLALLIMSGLLSYVGPTSAACAGPDVSIAKDAGRPGEVVAVFGNHFFDGCNDTGGSGSGCFGGTIEHEAEPVTATQNIEISIIGPMTKRHWDSFTEQGEAHTKLAERLKTVDADKHGHFSVYVRVPDLPPGR